jgi:nitrite reductase (NADH) large subunit
MPKVNKYICECKAVTNNNLLNAIRKAGAETLQDVQNLTKASTGCGRCKPNVLQVLKKELQTINPQYNQLKINF